MEILTTSPNVTPLREADGPGYRAPPVNIEAEQALLGGMLVNNRAYERVSEFLRPEHFADPEHGKIFEACGRLIERGQIANPVTLKHLFEGKTDAYVGQLARAAVTVLNAEDYGRAIHDCYLRRQLINLGEDVVNDAYSGDHDDSALGQIERAEQHLYDLATVGEYQRGFVDFRTALTRAIDMAEAAYKRDSRLIGVSTGLDDLDKLLGGLHASDLVILAGRPGMGKTALATNIAFSAARAWRQQHDAQGQLKTVDGAVVGFFSLEMSAEQLATRILGEEARVPTEKIRRGDLANDEFNKVVRASQALMAAPFFIDDTAALSVSALRTRARRLKRQHGLSLIVVDYLQLIHPTGQSREQNRVQEIAEITRGLKTLAKELNVPVLALSQLSRAVEQREDKRPQLSDLRESGAIEQDADVVMFLYREEYYLERREPREGTAEHADWQVKMDEVHNLAEVIVAKQRHGPTGKIQAQFDSRFTKFSNHVRADHLPDRTSGGPSDDMPF